MAKQYPWSRYRRDLPVDPKTRRLVRDLRGELNGLRSRDDHAMAAILMGVWSWARDLGEWLDGDWLVGDYELADLDHLTQLEGFGRALAEVGWVQEITHENQPALLFPKWDRWNASGKKARVRHGVCDIEPRGRGRGNTTEGIEASVDLQIPCLKGRVSYSTAKDHAREIFTGPRRPYALDHEGNIAEDPIDRSFLYRVAALDLLGKVPENALAQAFESIATHRPANRGAYIRATLRDHLPDFDELEAAVSAMFREGGHS